jgi:hypothetical protein
VSPGQSTFERTPSGPPSSASIFPSITTAYGKAMKFYEVAPFALILTPEAIRIAARTLSTDTGLEAELR